MSSLFHTLTQNVPVLRPNPIDYEHWYTAMADNRAAKRPPGVPDPEYDVVETLPPPSPSSPTSSLACASIIVSDISSPPTRSEDISLKARAGDLDTFVPSRFDYSKVEFARLPGFTKQIGRAVNRLNSPIWGRGVLIEEIETNHHFWLCLQCHQKHSKHKHYWPISKGTSNATKHIRTHHNEEFCKEVGGWVPLRNRGSTPLSDLDMDPVQKQAVLNQLAMSFNNTDFRNLVVRWIIDANLSFRQVDNGAFRDLIRYLNKQASVPHHTTLIGWIIDAHKLYKVKVVNHLRHATSRIHIAFDLWSSNNNLSMNGIIAHYLDASYEPQAILLAVPEQTESHYGVDIAAKVIKVIEEFEIEGDHIGWFMVDNASNNDIAIESIASHFGLDAIERRLRCAGHILNLIARSLLYGFDKKLFEQDSEVMDLQDRLTYWRRAGPIGKAHNLIAWTYASPQRILRWHKSKFYYNKVVSG